LRALFIQLSHFFMKHKFISLTHYKIGFNRKLKKIDSNRKRNWM